MIVGDLIPPRTPEAQEAAEFSSWVWTLWEQYPGARVQTPHVGWGHVSWMMARLLTLTKQKQHQLSHKLSACLCKTAFLKKLLFRRNWEMGSDKLTCEKHDFSQHIRTLSLAFSQWTVLRNESKGTIPLWTWYAFGREIYANYIVNYAKVLNFNEKCLNY